MNNSNQKGSNLIEVLAVLAIISSATIGLYAGISNIYGRFKMTRGVLEAKNSIKAMRDYFSSNPPTDLTITTETLVSIGVFNDYYDDEKKYANNFLGLKTEIKLSGTGEGKYSSDFSASGDPTFRMYYYDVPYNECISLLLSDWGNDSSSGLTEIAVNDKIFRWSKDHGKEAYYNLLPDIENAHTACTGKNGANVTIYWEYFF